MGALATPFSAARSQTTSLAPDEEVEFFSVDAVLDARRDMWIVPVHALVFEPERDPAARLALLKALSGALRLPADSPGNATFAQRALRFLVDHERDQRLVVSLAGQSVRLEPSEVGGHAHGTVEIPVATAAAGDPAHLAANSEWLTLSLVLPADDRRRFEGRVRLLPPTGLSVVSDIDDTLMLTESSDRDRMLGHTFLQPFEAVPGMAALYARCAEEGAAFHYISANPWQLAAPLTEFLDAAGFPSGPLALREFHWANQRFVDWFGASEGHKLTAIVTLAVQSPERKLILVGASVGRDPEVYGEIARQWPDRVERILIRDGTGEPRDDARYVAAFRDVPPERWTLFQHADELATLRAPPAPAAPSSRSTVPPLH